MRRNLYAIKRNIHVNKNIKRILIMVDFIAGLITFMGFAILLAPIYIALKIFKG
jgi:hypothetical protein